MGFAMSFAVAAVVLTAVLGAGMLGLLELGRRIGRRRAARDPAGATVLGTGPLEGAVFGILGLLLAFSFSGAVGRFDARRALIVDEANAIGTAYLRLDVLPAASQAPLRDLFRRYLDARLAGYRALEYDLDEARAEAARSVALQAEIWRRAVAATLDGAPSSAPVLLLPALNEMIDLGATRIAAARNHPPDVIFAMLFVLALMSSLLAGYGMAAAPRRSWVHMVGFALSVAIAIYVILDIEYPRRGFIQVSDYDELLVEVRESMR